MRAGDLAKALAELDPGTPVGFAHPAHDYWRSTLVSGVKAVETGRVAWSEYHSSLTLPRGDQDDDPDDDGDAPVVAVLEGGR